LGQISIADVEKLHGGFRKSGIADLGKSAKTAKVLVQSKNLLKQKHGLGPCLEIQHQTTSLWQAVISKTPFI
jgi:hypothetical protein